MMSNFSWDKYAEHGYAWQYNFSKDRHLSKRISLLYKKIKK